MTSKEENYNDKLDSKIEYSVLGNGIQVPTLKNEYEVGASWLTLTRVKEAVVETFLSPEIRNDVIKAADTAFKAQLMEDDLEGEGFDIGLSRFEDVSILNTELTEKMEEIPVECLTPSTLHRTNNVLEQSVRDAVMVKNDLADYLNSNTEEINALNLNKFDPNLEEADRMDLQKRLEELNYRKSCIESIQYGADDKYANDWGVYAQKVITSESTWQEMEKPVHSAIQEIKAYQEQDQTKLNNLETDLTQSPNIELSSDQAYKNDSAQIESSVPDFVQDFFQAYESNQAFKELLKVLTKKPACSTINF